MRTKDQILKECKNTNFSEPHEIIIELLFDIRDFLNLPNDQQTLIGRIRSDLESGKINPKNISSSDIASKYNCSINFARDIMKILKIEKRI